MDSLLDVVVFEEKKKRIKSINHGGDGGGKSYGQNSDSALTRHGILRSESNEIN